MDKGEFGGRVLDGLVRNACSLTSRVAAEDRCALEYSEDRQEGALRAALRLGGRLLLGLDLVHAWRNRRGIYSAEIVWTGTESQHLS